MNGKYSNFLTILLVLIIIAIVGIIGFLGYKYYESYIVKSTSEDFVDAFGNESNNNNNNNNNNNGNNNSIFGNNDSTQEQTTPENNENMFEGVEGGNGQNSAKPSGSKVEKFNGFIVAGTIEIPATNLKCPILDKSEYTPKALETSVVELYGPGLNQVGNTTISGHNYRNGTFFSNNKKLNVGDKIYITDLTGKRLTYTIYDKFEAEENYSDYMTRDTKGGIEISLSTCTDDSKARLIILAKANV